MRTYAGDHGFESIINRTASVSTYACAVRDSIIFKRCVKALREEGLFGLL